MGNVEIPKWLKGLPLAPEFRPTDTEFADPIAYISKIEKEAGAYGICKIIPPFPKPSKKYVFNNLNRSLSKCPELGSDVEVSKNVGSVSSCGDSGGDEGEGRAVFTTRHQELGQSGKRMKGVVSTPQCGVQKQVWQSGQIYTLEQFESKSKVFAKSLLGVLKEVSPLHIEALFWKLASEKPIYVEYANDVPGSGFGEPEGQYRYFHRKRRRRKRMSYRRENSDSKKEEMDTVMSSHIDEIKYTSVKIDFDTCLEIPKSSTTLSNMASDGNSHSKRKSENASNDMEGTAGWKLSNSPWNLQVIARSAGSLTRFMPDDIPGVTSPMVYIGMLFSWFAWHVEDHELHSMNFLHTGSSKTWYAVPGDYAFAFEEVVRSDAYGGDIDRLAALSLLGEKTTLLSPELIVASGIPCCRLIQNPGEFVVTFPRAYHVGFSHGFNCGEAANFGTPQWLQVAKEAAVRRAAMNYLPMLSHQQLLYLLTMSFVSRVPRSLLPGARSSRLRDRLKEEREVLVKKAFIEDLLIENKLLSLLLKRGSTYRAIIWDPDLLPCTSKDSELPSETATVSAILQENVCDIHCENNSNKNNLLDEMSLYMENLNYLYLNDDDLTCDFQVDSGTLACVACGILGYPFMSVVQPSEDATMELLGADHLSVPGPTVLEPKNAHSFPNLDCPVEGSFSDNVNHVGDLSLHPLPPITKFCDGWDTSNKYLRPRVFCLEHAVQVEELLQSKGGAKMLVICHSDYQKIKALAIPVAEDIGIPFNYNDVPLGAASQEDLNLINFAIDDERDEIGEDWTSKLGVNLRYCVKVRKNSLFKQVQHALPLNGLFSNKCGSSELFNVKWQSRKSRTKGKLNHPSPSKPCEHVEMKVDEILVEKQDGNVTKCEQKIIQYSRRKKRKPDYSTGAGGGPQLLKDGLPREDSAASSQLLDEHGGNKSEMNARSESARLVSSLSTRSTQTLLEIDTTLVVGVVQRDQSKILEESNLDYEACSLTACASSQRQCEIRLMERNGGNEISPADKCSNCCVVAAEERCVENIVAITEVCNPVSEGQGEELAASYDLINVANSASPYSAEPSAGRLDTRLEDITVEKFCMNGGAFSGLTSDNKVQQETEATCRNNEGILCDNKLIKKPNLGSNSLSTGVSLGNEMQQENNTGVESQVEPFLSSPTLTNGPSTVSVGNRSEVPKELCAAADSCDDAISKNKPQKQEMQINASKEELLSGSISPMGIDQPTSLSVEEYSVISKNSCAKEDQHTDVTLDVEVLQEIQATKGTNGVEVITCSHLPIKEKQPTPIVIEVCSEVQREGSPRKKSCADATADDDSHENNLIRNEKNEEKSVSCCVTPINQTTVPIQKYSRNRKESRATVSENDGGEVCSLGENRDLESAVANCGSSAMNRRKRKRELEETPENVGGNGFIKSPCEGLRPRARKNATRGVNVGKTSQEVLPAKEMTKSSTHTQNKKMIEKGSHRCDLEGCHMRFETREELRLHKRNRCPYESCGKKFRSHKYAILHQRVHEDDRPLKCPWKGCSMSFKWAWARTEHIRVHTGERPYQCKVEGCGLSFRFVSDFSRHRRKTGHYIDPSA